MLPEANGTNYQRLSLLHNTCSRSEYENSSVTFFSLKESQKQTELCLPPRQPDLHFHTLQPQGHVSNPHKGDETKGHSTSKRLGHGLGGTKNPRACLSPAHTLHLLPEDLAGLHWDTSSSRMMRSKTMRKSSQMWCSCGQLLLENEVKERTSPPSPVLHLHP